MNTHFDVYQLSEDYDALREAVRVVAENKIAPHAAEADRTQRLVMARHVLGA